LLANTFGVQIRSPKATRKPLPPKIAALLRESWWLLLVGAALYLVLILFTYRKSDPAWSYQAAGSLVANAGGKAGAWIADILLYVVGLSAWWLVFFLLAAVVWGYRRLDAPEMDRRSLAVACGGFLLLITASSALESLRLYALKVSLPHAPGGVLGDLVSGLFSKGFGYTAVPCCYCCWAGWGCLCAPACPGSASSRSSAPRSRALTASCGKMADPPGQESRRAGRG